MRKIGLKEKELIEIDSLRGVGQDKAGSSMGQYKSEQYKKYKANYMNRFTNKAGRQKTVKGQTIEGKYRITTGGKLKAYQGQPIASNETAFVNMTLTGQMAKGLHVKSSAENMVEMSYLAKDAGKIYGNSLLGRQVVGLNDKNIEAIKFLVMSELSKGIDEWAKEDVRITIKI
jgi:hypothetical protein